VCATAHRQRGAGRASQLAADRQQGGVQFLGRLPLADRHDRHRAERREDREVEVRPQRRCAIQDGSRRGGPPRGGQDHGSSVGRQRTEARVQLLDRRRVVGHPVLAGPDGHGRQGVDAVGVQ